MKPYSEWREVKAAITPQCPTGLESVLGARQGEGWIPSEYGPPQCL
jgi:hypothetical protein